jgi:hypothetical protein
MTDDSAVVAYYSSEEAGEPGPVVDLDAPDWGSYYGADKPPVGGSAEWNDPEDTWVLDIGKDAANAAEARAAVQREWDSFKARVVTRHFDDQLLLSDVEKVYSTSRAAEFFGRSTQWIYWGLRNDPETGAPVFVYKNGTPILPERVGTMGKRRFTLPIIREIALCCYRRGNLTEDELEAVMARILLAEFGSRAFANPE